MKKIFSLILMFGLFVPLVSASEIQESVITSEATKTADVNPDTVTIKFYVENSGINLNDIKEKNDKTVNEALVKIKSKLNSDEQIKTIAFSVQNVYSYKDKVRIFQKYVVRNGFEVKLKDLTKISQIVKIAMDAGVKEIGQLNFTIENGEKVCNDMMADAVKIAKNRAYYLAKAAGNEILKPKSINPYCSLNASHYVQPRLYNSKASFGAMSSADGAAEALDTIEPGSINVRAGANVVYYLK